MLSVLCRFFLFFFSVFQFDPFCRSRNKIEKLFWCLNIFFNIQYSSSFISLHEIIFQFLWFFVLFILNSCFRIFHGFGFYFLFFVRKSLENEMENVFFKDQDTLWKLIEGVKRKSNFNQYQSVRVTHFLFIFSMISEIFIMKK